MSGQSTTPPTTTEPVSRSNPLWVIGAVAFLSLVLVAGLAYALRSRDGDSEPQQAPAQASPAPVQDQGQGFGTPITDRWGNRVEVPVNQFGQVLTQDSSQQLKPGDPSWLSATAKGIKWQLVYNIPIPFSTSDGPTKVADKVASGYAHTPQGAVLAAIDAMSRCSVLGDDVAVACWEKRMVEGPGYADMEKRVRGLGAAPRQLEPGSSIMPLSWAKVLNYADDYMAAQLAQIDPTNPQAYAVYQVEMVWSDGDWKMKYTNNANTAQTGVTSLDGFTRW